MQNSQSSTTEAAPSASHPSIRASRKSEWLRSALAHHYDPDPGVENEIVVLATGIDQYLQEVFHHLAYYNGDDLVSAEDFRLLCYVVGMFGSEEGAKEKSDGDETRWICSGLPRELNFKEFHARLCGYFSLRARNSKPDARLLVTEETEHIEREIRLRWPRVRRRKCVSFDLSKDDSTARRAMHRLGSILKLDNLHHCAGELDEEADSSLQGAALQQVETENASLRELVEDLRAALQASDARCLALEVTLHRERGARHRGTARERGGVARGERPITEEQGSRGARDLLRELELIRASRDGQLEEAMRFNQRLEEELRAANEERRRLEGVVIRLQMENGKIKRKAEEARSALAGGLERVREIQEQAQLVPSLQAQVQELEAERQRYSRSQCTCRAEADDQDGPPAMTSHSPQRHSPTGRDESCNGVEESFQRAVEGRAASDEEEEERGSEEGQCCLVEVKRLLNRLRCCAKGCQNTARHLLLSQTCFHANTHNSITASMELRGRGHRSHTLTEEKGSELEKCLCSIGRELQLKQDEVEMLRLEVQMVETERVRLSLLEEKLTDALTLLLQLRTKDISRRSLGKIFMDTLDVCNKAGHGPSQVPQVLDALCQQLLSCELLREGAGPQTGTGSKRDAANPLLISC
ncbi:EF-hand and coiled-coil domain-containing protein 1-like [Megalops cyprinoides]|uniref:EF-hand and coiled-coil domain-containing protein 1-like n=1 Tax=Megalops cyprinoides TaxID=118141 RepID=UPI00186568B6|nr:EF-hand and coiled-coil domain-containing protein 1-like [Megalops cyprinoides]